MATLHLYAANLERLEGLLFGADPAKSRYGDPEKLIDHLLNESVLERARAGTSEFDPEVAERALRELVAGPRPESPPGRLHALVLHGIVETLCAHLGDSAFGPTTIHALGDFGAKWERVLGPGLADSLTNRRLPFVQFSDEVSSPFFSYWMHDEIKGFLRKLPEAQKAPAGDGEALHRLHEAWTNLLGQGPDAILVGIV